MSVRKQRPKTVAFRVSIAERAQLMREAHERGITVADVLRSRVFPDRTDNKGQR